tara:strand:- start:19094 stop:22474 length:3381 start_codon:yes stop_codon:yes gene_type:complete
MSEYADIKLIECNRQQSIQGTSGNNTEPAQFTCRLGNTIQLKAGDSVEVMNAFVSEDGAGGETIELKGESIKDGFGVPITQTYEYTRLEIDYWDESRQIYTVDRPLNRANVRVKDLQAQPLNTFITKEIKDNELNFEQSYYISANGENYYSYPRGFLWNDYLTGSTIDFSNLLVDAVYEVEDAPTLPPNPSGSGTPMSGMNYGVAFKESLIATCDYFLSITGGSAGKPAGSATSATYNFYKPIIDNERYTCFCKTLMVSPSKITEPDQDFKTSFNKDCHTFNPILNDFVEYKELKTITIPAGHISQNGMAEQFTQQLQKAYEYDDVNDKELLQPQTFESFEGFNTGTTPNNNTILPYNFVPNPSFNLKTPTLSSFSTESYKPFEGWSPVSSNINAYLVVQIALAPAEIVADMADKFETAGEQDKMISIFKWFQQSQWIYVKRPELFTLGRKINTYLGALAEDNGTFSVITNAIANDQDIGSTTIPIRDSYETNIRWTDANLERFRDLFIAQSKYYKDLIEAKMGTNKLVNKGLPVFSDLYDEARFLHASRMDLDPTDSSVYGRLPDGDLTKAPYPFGISGLGSDGYRASVDADEKYLSTPVFFAYQTKNANKYTSGEDPEDLCYGAMFRRTEDIGGGDINHYITFRNDLIKSIDFNLFDNIAVDGAGNKTLLASTRCIGWDWHARSYGNVILGGTSGYLSQNTTGDYFYGKNSLIPSKDNGGGTTPIHASNLFEHRFSCIDQFNVLRYVGAINPSLTFDQISGTFGWRGLHTAENTGQPDLAGSEHTQVIQHPAVPPAGTHGGSAGWTESIPTGIPLNPQAPTEVYKINKRLRYNCYCPDARPYNLDAKGLLSQVNSKDGRTIDAFETDLSIPNTNMKSGTIFDSHCGIYLNLANACPKQYWGQSLIGILGFTWEQYNPTVINHNNNRLQRIDNNNLFSLPLATTNAQVVSTDLKQYPMNIWGAITYSTQVAVPIVIPIDQISYATAKSLQYRSAIVEQTESIVLRAQGLPKLMSRPYFTIRTDLLDTAEYTGGLSGGLKLPIIGLVDKMEGAGSYYFTEAGGMTFTLTHDRSISSITTSIHDPDGTLARVDETSAVIYKISRTMNTGRFNILQQILAEEQPKKKS